MTLSSFQSISPRHGAFIVSDTKVEVMDIGGENGIYLLQRVPPLFEEFQRLPQLEKFQLEHCTQIKLGNLNGTVFIETTDDVRA